MSRDNEQTQLGSIKLFCKAAELGNFTAAATAIGVTPAAISRSIGRIEARLGVRLFVRTTRQVRLTEEGRAYYDQCRQAILQIEEAERAIMGNQATPSGVLRISVPTTYGHYRVVPQLPKFKALYPKLQIEINMSNRNIDFVEEGFDLAIRMGEPKDSRMVAVKLEDATLGIYASPTYLRLQGTPRKVEDLVKHDCIQFVLPSSGRPMPWLIRQKNTDRNFTIDSTIKFEGDVLGCVNYAKAGGGLFQIYHFIGNSEENKDKLVEILKPYSGSSRPFSILYPQNRHLSAKVRAFVDFMLHKVKA